MSQPSASHLRSLYRALLRELPPRPILTRASDRAPLHNRLRATFAPGSPATPLPAAHAEGLAAYLKSQRTYAMLVERYNPGMNMDDEERVRLTARRVGMDLPEEFMDRLNKK